MARALVLALVGSVALVLVVGAPGGASRRPVERAGPGAHHRAHHRAHHGAPHLAPAYGNSAVQPAMLALTGLDQAKVAVDAGQIWAVRGYQAGGNGPGCASLVHIDPKTLAVVGGALLSSCPMAVTVGPEGVWLLSDTVGQRGFQLQQLDPASLHAGLRLTLAGGPTGDLISGDTQNKYCFVATDGTDVVAGLTPGAGSQLVAVDGADGTVTATAALPGKVGQLSAMSSDGPQVWFGTDGGWVGAFDPFTGTVSQLRQVGEAVTSLSATGSTIWVGDRPLGAGRRGAGLDVVALDARHVRLALDTHQGYAVVAADRSGVWALSSVTDERQLVQLDPSTGAVARSYELPAQGLPESTVLVAAGTHAYAVDGQFGTVYRVS